MGNSFGFAPRTMGKGKGMGKNNIMEGNEEPSLSSLFNLEENFSKAPLGLPLLLSAVGTVLSLYGGKKWHAVFGGVWTALSLLHGLQHRKKLGLDAKKLLPAPQTSPQNFRIASNLPGRVRVYSLFSSNEVQTITNMINSIPGVYETKVNPTTGSILITYDENKLAVNDKATGLSNLLLM